ncbi:hypothetical protein [Micromonospora sp. NPDC048839]|uniref:hypothetical protein n=1 Tax=Micromonospora sp. NPDC048839 TaxID=3155641 RepID=UPI0033DAA2E3
MRRFKWFVPRQDDQAYQPFGIYYDGAAPLYGHRGGWNLAGATGPDQPTAQEAAATNREFWENLERAAVLLRAERDRGGRAAPVVPAEPDGRRRGDEGPSA